MSMKCDGNLPAGLFATAPNGESGKTGPYVRYRTDEAQEFRYKGGGRRMAARRADGAQARCDLRCLIYDGANPAGKDAGMKPQPIPIESSTPRTEPSTEPQPAGERSSTPGCVRYSLSFQNAAASGPLTARAAANIAEWSTYLPKDCVEAMIRDGWHLTV